MNTQTNKTERAPVIAIMGHIDHGKSTLLSFIRKNLKPLDEAGGITQHVSAYEVEHKDGSGKIHQITFLDTPGHEAFSGIRTRGAKVADMAILVVSAEDGVKLQTIEALKSIKKEEVPFIVAINKIDKPGANVDMTKQSLAENQIYVEGYGGDIPVVLISAKTGQGIPDLLDMIILVSELEELSGDRSLNASGVIIESNRDIKKGISSTCIIKNGTLKKGMFVASGESMAPLRIIEDYLEKPIDEASFSKPIKIIGWDTLPEVGEAFESFHSKNEALEYVEKNKAKNLNNKSEMKSKTIENTIPIVLKADTAGSLEAVIYEIEKLGNERIIPEIVLSGVGSISENDIRMVAGSERTLVIGFNTKTDAPARTLAERNNIEIHHFTIIYKLSEFIKEMLENLTPKIKEEEVQGKTKVLKSFSKIRDKQIIGCRVEDGILSVGSTINILRRDEKIGEGKIKGLECQKNKTNEVSSGKECGVMLESRVEIVPGDYIENFIIVEK
ncbi:MAG: translation initiation factor IF-2 [Candidatus Paceibacterota bacterium]